MNSTYEELGIELIELDLQNPRIARFLEMYGKVDSEAISLALGGGASEEGGTSYQSLKDSIKSSGGIIHPIIVNREKSGKLIVIEGNTRVQIYKEFKELNVPGNWDVIKAIVYENLSEEEIHAIRLQSHLVGPRDWDSYSKAKYLNYLSNELKLPIAQLISFCGGKESEITKLINAYNEVEKYYRPNIDPNDFDQRDFSKFSELQPSNRKQSLYENGFNVEDFAKWVINGKVDNAMKVRYLPEIFKTPEAKEVFLSAKNTISDAYNRLQANKAGTLDLDNVPYDTLANELSRRLDSIEYKEVTNLKNNPDYEEKKNSLYNLMLSIDSIKEYIADGEY